MAIPTLVQEQVDLLESMASGLGAFSTAVPEEAKDGKETYEAAMVTVRDNEQLLIMGLIKDITEAQMDKIATLFSMTGRQFKVYEITDIGRRMFSDVGKRTIQ
jgi:hypothetical protein